MMSLYLCICSKKVNYVYGYNLTCAGCINFLLSYILALSKNGCYLIYKILFILLFIVCARMFIFKLSLVYFRKEKTAYCPYLLGSYELMNLC